jgi:hypothetical protein
MVAPYYTFRYDPSKGYGANVAQTSLTRWLNQQKEAKQQFAAAEQPLQQAVQMFQRGGGYGQGQRALLQDEARRALAESLTSQVASGMSSGSLATSTALRTKSDLAKNLAGVEDVRTQFLNQALQALSGARSTRAQTLASIVDPVTAPYLSYLGGQDALAAQQASDILQANTALRTAQTQSSDAASAIVRNSYSPSNIKSFKY